MAWIRSEEEVDQMIEDMIKKNKGKYITQGVSFSKDSERQLELLKLVLMRSGSFSGFVKELLAKEIGEDKVEVVSTPPISEVKIENSSPIQIEAVEKKNIGNFL